MSIIQLFRNNSQENVINKELEFVELLNGNFRGGVSIGTPIITIQNNNFYDFNYCYITDTHTYYYIDNIVLLNKNILELHLREDVLMTTRNYSMFTDSVIARNEYDYNDYLADEEIATTIDVENEFDVVMESPFLNSMDRDIYPYNIIVVIGGSQ